MIFLNFWSFVEIRFLNFSSSKSHLIIKCENSYLEGFHLINRIFKKRGLNVQNEKWINLTDSSKLFLILVTKIYRYARTTMGSYLPPLCIKRLCHPIWKPHRSDNYMVDEKRWNAYGRWTWKGRDQFSAIHDDMDDYLWHSYFGSDWYSSLNNAGNPSGSFYNNWSDQSG